MIDFGLGVLCTLAAGCGLMVWDCRRIYRELPPEVQRVLDETSAPWMHRWMR